MVECVVRLGDPAEEIIGAARDADLIVIASVHLGSGRLADGSVADRVARHAPIPTMIVRAEGTVAPARFARVVVPLDGSAQAEAAVPLARHFCEDLGVPLHLMRVVEPALALDLVEVGLFSTETYESTVASLKTAAEEEFAAVHAREMGRGMPVSSELRVGAPAAELIAALHPDDLVVMTTHGAGGTVGWCIGGVAEKLLRRAPAPVVLLHARLGFHRLRSSLTRSGPPPRCRGDWRGVTLAGAVRERTVRAPPLLIGGADELLRSRR
jgi:nucleotide-binding universal stress UspA family protein